ncbi:MAG: Chitin synthase, class 3 [Chaenotheca gracillima]|nr:MAG: Chitin synthase, class 3 [Chaenotheca gracillima]
MYGGGGGGGGGQHTNGSMGEAAAMQALKMFTSGGAGSGGQGSQGGGNNQSQFIGMAMGQASRLFDQQNGSGNVHPSASKEGVVQEAAKMALKMYMKGQMGGGGGGAGGLMGMAGKLLG